MPNDLKKDAFLSATVAANSRGAEIIGLCARAFYDRKEMGEILLIVALEQAAEKARELQAAINAALDAAKSRGAVPEDKQEAA